MNKKYFFLPLIAAVLVFLGVQWQSLLATDAAGREKGQGKIQEAVAASATSKKVLVAYFSRSGSTRELASQIHERVGGDMIEVKTEEPYPSDYEAVKEQARQELMTNSRPKLVIGIANMAEYDVVFIGYPIWWGTIPMPIASFLTSYDFSGKTIVPFCTHAGSGLGNSAADIAKLSPQATVLGGLAVAGRDVSHSQDKLEGWLGSLTL